jgi:hypothetical protein
MVQPDGVADDLSCEPMAIVGVGWRHHPISLIALRAYGQTGYRDNATRTMGGDSCVKALQFHLKSYQTVFSGGGYSKPLKTPCRESGASD